VRPVLAVQHTPMETLATLGGALRGNLQLEVNERLVRGMLEDFQDEAREAGEDPYEFLRQAFEHLPQLLTRAGRLHERFLRLR
jgi:hypothetical protein